MANARHFLILLAAATCLLRADTVPAQTAPQATSKPAPSPAPVPAQTKPAPADDTAFPEEQSKAAQKAADAGDKAASDGPATTQDPGDDAVPESSSRSRIKNLDVLGDHDSRSDNGAGGIVNDPKLADDDIRIGQLYMGRGNYSGAYERFKEATKVNPGSSDAVFYLAEAARKTSRLDEAATNYKTYLDADPKGKRAKDARKALQQLAGN